MEPPSHKFSADIWIAACAHRLQQRWRTVDPLQLEEVADELLHDARLGCMAPADAADVWLQPVGLGTENHRFTSGG
ncbi:hypothetical protein [Polaromonas sp.]|uniref:hypothetical protein n=1 Tax=Polaromonas sp. TaxID=1869339 RepID=UPI00352A9648